MTPAPRRWPCGFTAQPVDSDCFVGRFAELRELLQRALTTSAPLVNLVGPGKIGRTSFLQYLREVSRKRGKGTDFESLFGGPQRLITPLFDLGLRRDDTTIRETTARAIADEMRLHKLDTPTDEDLAGHAALEILTTSMTNAGPDTLFLLLVDRAEHVLVDDAELADDPWAGGAVDALGTLNDAVPSFGLVLSFGVGGPVSTLDARARESREQQLLVTVSRLLNLVVDRIELGLLDRADVVEFARHADVPMPGSERASLTDAEVEWIADIAGGHPFVLHRAGLRAWMLKVEDPAARLTREKVEEELVESLGPFIGMAVRRLAGSEGALEAAGQLAVLENGGHVPVAVADALAGEGLAVVGPRPSGGHVECRVPSWVIRAALQRQLEQGPAVAPIRGTSPAAASTPPPPFSLSVDGPDGQLHIARVTPSEHNLLEQLLSASPGALVSRDQLLPALGQNAHEQHLTQRLSVLRKKIRDELGLPDAIENVYNHGYRLVDAEAFRLRGE